MGAGLSFPQDKHIVIIGGGYGGIELADKLMNANANFTLIDAKDHFYHNWGAVRATSEKDFVDRLFFTYTSAFESKFMQGKVINIDVGFKKVILDSGEAISYDAVVIATGSYGDLPFKLGVDNSVDQMKAFCAETYEKLQTATNVVVIGGGAVGTEVAAEIATDYKDKTVTLLHSSYKLLAPAGFTSEFHQTLQEKLRAKGIRLVLGEKVQNLPSEAISGPCELTTNRGTKIQADVVYKCTGVKTSTTAYSHALGHVMESNGQLKVNEYLQVEGYENVFAIGDCTNTKEIKTAYRAMEQAKVVANNLQLYLENKPLNSYDPASNNLFLMGVTIGRDDAVAQTASGTLIPAFIMTMFKSQDLGVSLIAKTFRQPWLMLRGFSS